VSWNAGVFHADNSDDILFVASEQTAFGYFKNFGKTRRQGVELGVNARKSRLAGGAGYTWLDATFHSEETVDGTGNSTNEEGSGREGTIEIEPGHRIPLVPRHMFKAFADLRVMPKLSVDVNLVSASGVIARGNENNAHQPDGTYYLGPGSTPAYGVVNIGVRYDLNKVLQLIAQFNNVFDGQYYTAAQLQGTAFTSTGNFIARPLPAVGGAFPVQQATFYAPGAPATYWIGTRARF
jgi:outer membrane receptor protein involved in Fe transport